MKIYLVYRQVFGEEFGTVREYTNLKEASLACNMLNEARINYLQTLEDGKLKESINCLRKWKELDPEIEQIKRIDILYVIKDSTGFPNKNCMMYSI